MLALYGLEWVGCAAADESLRGKMDSLPEAVPEAVAQRANFPSTSTQLLHRENGTQLGNGAIPA